MCGINGVWGLEHSGELVQEMNGRLIHRGPDAQDVYIDTATELALGHVRLAILDLSEAGNQPYTSQCGRFIMVYNGEVYNFRSIANELESLTEINWKSSTDTEVILEAFCYWGEDFVSKLNGMFAIAIFDKETKLIRIWRDRVGIKPVYYHHSANVFGFSSELAPIKHAFKLHKINPEAVHNYFHLGYVPAPHTIWEGCKKLPPGHQLTWDGKSLRISSWWATQNVIPQSYPPVFSDRKNMLKELISNAVEQRLVSDVPFGTFLSGGIDSSLVTAFASKHYGKGLKTFSIAMDSQSHDESEYASEVSKQLATDHTCFRVSATEGLKWVEQLPDIYHEPFADSSAIPSLIVAGLAKEKVSMVLTGDGGDELFLGYGAHVWAKRIYRKPKSLLRLASFGLSFGSDRHKRVAELLNVPDSSSPWSHIFSQEQYLFSQMELSRVLDSSLSGSAVPMPFIPKDFDTEPMHTQALYDLHYYLPDDLLVKVDRATMHFALEARVPLLDYRVVEWALHAPLTDKFNKGESKYILKQILYDVLPKSLFQRPKWGFSVPLAKWMNKELSPLVTKWVEEEGAYSHGFVNFKVAQNYLRRFRSGETRLYNRIWLILQFNMWYGRNH